MQMLQEPQQQMAWYMRFIQWLLDMLKNTDIEFTEVQNIFIKLMWGLWLINPMWSTFAMSRGFMLMASIAREEVWGTAIVIVAILHIISLRWHIHKLRVTTCFMAFLFWLLVSIMLISANPSGTGAVVYPILTFSSAWIYVRVVALLGRE